MKFSIVVTVTTLAGLGLAHGGVNTYIIDGQTYHGYRWADPENGQENLIQRTWNAKPLTDPYSKNITCNYKGTTVPGAFHAPARAGATISASWVEDGFGWVHTLGPITAYMAFCGDDCSAVIDIQALKWFKIAEEGLRPGYVVGNESGWLQYDLWESRKTDHWDVVIPVNLKAGRYMIRHEIINLELSPVQFYPNCAQLEVSGSGLSFPGDDYLVQFPGAYSLSDPGIAISGKVRNDKTTKNYTVPGPKLWTG